MQSSRSDKEILSRFARLRTLPAAGLLCLLLLFLQSVELLHAHGNDLQLQADCDICLKLGHGDEAITVAEFTLSLEPATENPVSSTSNPYLVALAAPNARAPPSKQ
ncbi:MAG: hypothetical protein RQ757_04960 [Pseudomonadales bacterium]|nr:hypothetical protein [Pseudomonadales bacterium]